MVLEIRLIGELAVVRDGVAVPLPASKKTRALLGYLAATGRPQLREKLCSVLWDNPDDPRAALRWSLTKLRPLVDDVEVRLVADRERVELVPGTASVDLAAVRAAVPAGVAGVAKASLESLRAIAPHLRGELLEGLDLPDCYRYDEWLRGEREAMRRLAAAVLTTLVAKTTGEEALGYARARLVIEPLEEGAHTAAIRLLVELDRKAEAMAQYASCVRLLERELGHGPSRELERLRIAVDAERRAAPEPKREPIPEVVTPATPFVGRSQERATLARVLDAGPKRVAVVLGDPGIGKTRLLEDLATTARSRGLEVFAARGVEAEVVRPFGAWLDALAGAGDPFRAANDADADRNRLFDAVTAWLVARGDVLVIVDDVQWIDDASAALLHYVARAPTASRVRLACGARPGELADNAAALRLVRGLTREGAIHQIGLSPLDAADTVALAVAHAPGIDASRVFAESGGHPLFAVEIARALARGDTTWDSLDELLGERLELVDGTARELVPWAAALGGAFEADLLATITGLPLGEIGRGVDELERRAIVRAVGHEWDFVHDLVRTAAYNRVSEPRRRLLHLQIARSLTELPDPVGERAVSIAHHAQLGGDRMLCATACLAAGERCLRLFAPQEAATYADRGLAQIAKLTGPKRVSLHIDLLSLAVLADTRRRRLKALAIELERAIVDAQAHGVPAAAARGFNSLSHFHFESGDLDNAQHDSLEAAQRIREADPLTQARTLAHAAQCIALVGEMPKAEALAAEAAEMLPAGTDIPELPFALALIRYHQGDTAAAVTLVEHATALADRDGIHWLAGYGHTRAAQYRLELGHIDEAAAHCNALRAESDRFGDTDVALGAVIGACVELHAKRLGDVGSVETALQRLRDQDAPLKLLHGLCVAAETELSLGAFEAALRHSAQAVTAALRTKRLTEVATARALASRVAAVTGHLDDARTELEHARAIDVLISPRAQRAIAAAEDALRN